MRSPRAVLLLALLAGALSCGARTPLEAPLADAGPLADGALSCAQTAPAGTVQWRATLAQSRGLVGPLAADAEGNTFFALDPALAGLPRSGAPLLYSLDRCGRVRWSSPWEHFQNRSVRVHALLAGPNLVVGDGDLQSFDAATGRHQWTADLVALAAAYNLGDTSGGDALRRVVADAEGALFVMLQSPATLGMLRVDAGSPRLLFSLPTTRGQATATDLVLDSAGRLLFAVTDTNVNPGPGVLYAYSTAGARAYALHLPVVNYQDHLAVGAGYVVLGDTGSLVSNDGTVLRSLGGFVGSVAVDADGSLVTLSRHTGDDGGLQAFDVSGAPRWSAPLRGGYAFNYEGGPLLGQRNAYSVFYRSESFADGGVRSTAVLLSADRTSGAAASYAFAGSWQGSALLLPSGLVVFAVGNDVLGVSTGGDGPATDALWPTPHGGNDQRGAPRGR